MTSHSLRPTDRFSDRVADYVRFRPGYPDAMVEAIEGEARLGLNSVIADVGSGTGISAGLFLRRGYTVFAVEPNHAMRAAAESRLGGHRGFRSVEATAEATTLPDASVDVVAAGQAFHWFDLNPTRREFARILRLGGMVGLFWNTRQEDSTAFLRAYETLLQTHGTDYRQSNHRRIDARQVEAFFGGGLRYFSFPNQQVFDHDGLRGRLLSSSYVPAPGEPGHDAMLQDLRRIFEEHQEGGQVRFLYDTELFLGRLG